MVVESEIVEESRTEVGYSVGRSDGNVGSYVGISLEHGYGNIEGTPLRYALGPGYLTGGDSYDGI